MAASELDMDKIVQIFREVVKRKTTYNETNLHYEYFKRAGDTIPYKAHGFATLRELIQKRAGDWFYFEKVDKDFEFIAPKRAENTSTNSNLDLNPSSNSYAEANSDLKKVCVVKKVAKSVNGSNGLNSAKTIRVSNNIHFGQPQSTGLNNPFQNIRNDIKISFNFDAQKREVDRYSTNGEKASESGSSTNDKQSMSVDGDDAHSGAYSMAQNSGEQMENDEFDDELPWDDKYWHLKITHAVSTNEVWARFFDDFEDEMRKMTSKIIRKVTTDPKQPRLNSTDEYHVVKDALNYYRAIILKIEPEINQCKCFLVDVGEVKWFDTENIFRCPYEFRHTSPMAMRFCLYGFFEFRENRNACEIIAEELENKELWAKIKIKPKEFYKENGKYHPIPVILYDSMDKHSRVNISSIIMNKLVATFKPPKLSKNHTNYVTVTHISKVTGNIYCHLNNSANDLKYVSSMIEALVENGIYRYYENIQSETELHELLAINANKLYMIYSEYERRWYRAMIVQLETDLSESSSGENIDQSCRVYCFFVDYGHTRVVKLTNVYNLPGILAHYPHLAVTVALDGVHMTYAKIDRLKELLLPGDNIFVDVVETMECSDSNKTKTITLAKVTKLEKDIASGETYACEINRLL